MRRAEGALPAAAAEAKRRKEHGVRVERRGESRRGALMGLGAEPGGWVSFTPWCWT